MIRVSRAAQLLLSMAFLCCATLASAQPVAPAGQDTPTQPQAQEDSGWSGPSFGLPAFAHAPAEESSHLLVICRELEGRIEVLSSQVVPGPLKPAYRLHIRPQQAQLLDSLGAPMTSAFYDVEREVRWPQTKPQSSELIGGGIPAPEIVFNVRVPLFPEAQSLRLARVVDADAWQSVQAQSLVSPQTFMGSIQTDTLITIPLAELPGPPEAKP